MFIVTICKQKHPSCQLPQLPQFLKGKINLQNRRCCMYGYDKRTAKGFALMSPTTPLPHLHWCRYILLDELKVCDILDHVTCAEQPVMSVPVCLTSSSHSTNLPHSLHYRHLWSEFISSLLSDCFVLLTQTLLLLHNPLCFMPLSKTRENISPLGDCLKNREKRQKFNFILNAKKSTRVISEQLE